MSHNASQTVTYLDATLSIKKIHDMILEKYPGITNNKTWSSMSFLKILKRQLQL